MGLWWSERKILSSCKIFNEELFLHARPVFGDGNNFVLRGTTMTSSKQPRPTRQPGDRWRGASSGGGFWTIWVLSQRDAGRRSGAWECWRHGVSRWWFVGRWLSAKEARMCLTWLQIATIHLRGWISCNPLEGARPDLQKKIEETEPAVKKTTSAG